MSLPAGELLLRLAVAVACGALIGFERESAARGAGTRTMALVALGSAMFTLAGAYGFSDERFLRADPSRAAAQVAAGVGFIGAGAILRHGTSVHGMTTAAAVWTAAATGVVSAAGGYILASVATLATLGVLAGLKPLTRRLRSNRTTLQVLVVDFTPGDEVLRAVLATLDRFALRTTALATTEPTLGRRHARFDLVVEQEDVLPSLVATVAELPDVHGCAIETTSRPSS